MHFVNRSTFKEAPISILEKYNLKYKEIWAKYNTARINKIKPLPAKPPSLWCNDEIRKPLKKLFFKNCGYCGIHCDIGMDGEVDHFFPASKDINADHVFDWTNYIWACHSCNGLKRDNYPFLNPCSLEDMRYIYFHPSDGKYLLLHKSPKQISDKYNLTDNKSNLNIKNRPDSRKLLYRNLQQLLSNIYLSDLMYKAEYKKSGKSSIDCINKLKSLESKKQDLIDLIKRGECLLLIKHTIEEFHNKKPLPNTFGELLEESDYLPD